MDVEIIEMPDRYFVVDAETGENLEPDDTGFSDYHSARRWAERNGHDVQD